MASEQRGYRAYLLRMWQIMSAGQLVWRASLEDARTGTHLGFASLEQLIVFLTDETRGATQPGEEPSSTAEERGA
jgi:hypothetical protein